MWQDIPDFLIESIQKRAMHIIFPLMNYNEALIALNLTTLSEKRTHLCQVDRLRNENHPFHPGAHQEEPLSPIFGLGVNPFPSRSII